MSYLIPEVSVTDRHTWNPRDVIPTNTIVVRLGDLLTPETLEPNAACRRIIAAGGIREFFNWHGDIILSLIINDDIIIELTPEKYAHYINGLQPTHYITVDGETYHKEQYLSAKEIQRTLNETAKLIGLCPGSTPIGLVKGCTRTQIRDHVLALKKLGVEDFALHAGEFLRHGRQSRINTAREYAHIIKKHGRRVYLYGLGSPKRMTSFSFCDAFITFSHCVTALKGRQFDGARYTPYSGGYRREIVMRNLLQLYKAAQGLNTQTRLQQWEETLWVTQVEECEHHTPKGDTPVRTAT